MRCGLVMAFAELATFVQSATSSSQAHSTLAPSSSKEGSTLSELLDYENNSDLASIPEREWRLLAALARKREEENERQKLAEQFHRMWEKEKAGREMMEAQTSDQYKRFVRSKRDAERAWLDHKRTLLNLDQQLKKGRLQDAIRYKEMKAEELLASKEDRKATELVDKAIEEEARFLLAADRRTRQQTAAEFRKRLEAEDTKRRADEALRKREGILRDSSRRLAISSALNTWETSVVREQLAASDAARRAQYAALAAMTEARGARLARSRDARRHRARQLAAKCELWRDAVRAGSY